MKAEILKIAGVKSEKEFYKLFPDEKSFKAKYGKELKKAAMGSKMVKTQLQQLTDFGNPPIAQVGAQLDMWGNPVQQNITQMPTNPNAGTGQMGLNNAPGGIMNLTPNAAATNATNQLQMFGTGADIKQGGALGGKTPDSIKGVGSEMLGKGGGGALGKLGGVGGIASTASAIIGGIQGLKEEKKQLKQSEQDKALSNLTLQATSMRPEKIKNKYVRPEDAMVQPEQLFPSYGVGTNVLAEYGATLKAQNGLVDSGNKSFILPPITQNREVAESTFMKKPLNSSSHLSPHEQTFEEYYIAHTSPEERDAQIRADKLHMMERSPSQRPIVNRNGGITNMQIGGNLGEIQNTYAPNNLYDDLGYEPLSDSEIVKQYRAGGFMPRAQSGFQQMSDYSSAGGADQAGQLFGAAGSAIGGSGFKQNAGSQLGGGIGKAAGSLIGGPIGGLIGSALGSLTGGLLDQKGKKIAANQKATQKNVETGAFQSGAQALQSQNSAFVRDGGLVPYEEGGWVSHDWQPQVIATFGENKMSDLLKPDPMMNTLRAGGHISQNYVEPSQRALDTMALGGELKTTWGGYAEPMSQNPYMPGTGETVMFRGKSHDEGDGNGHTGIGVKYGDGGKMTDYAEFGSESADADVEVERGEPATEMTDGQGQKNMVVFGNLQIPNQLLNHIGDPNAKGKKFKNYVADLAKKEAKQNKIIDKSTNSINELNVYTPFDKLNLDAHQANIIGANMNLKTYADYKMNAAAVQNAINDTAAEHGLDADHLAKGKHIKDKEAMKQQAKFGKEIFKAQTGTKLPAVKQSDYEYLRKLYDEAKAQKRGDKVLKFQQEYHRLVPDYAKKVLGAYPPTTHGGKHKPKYTNKDLASNEDTIFGKRTERYMEAMDNAPRYEGTIIPSIPESMPVDSSNVPITTTETTIQPVEALKRSKLMDAANQLLPYARPTDADYRVDLNPEMTALSMNQLEPVQAQLYHPQLLTPYDVSYQDQLNEVTAQSREAERMTGQNPAAAAAIMAQANRNKSQILGEQFRQNQGQRMGVYNQNIASLNDAQLKNLGILDTQYGRQAEAKSKTKQQAIEVAKSMADKIDKNKLENRTLQTYENMYNYRFGANGKAENYNPLQQFDVALGGSGTGKTSGGIAPGYEFTYDASGNIIGTKKSAKSKDDARNGSIVKAIKGL